MAKAKRKPRGEMPEMIPDTPQERGARHPADAPAERRVGVSEGKEVQERGVESRVWFAFTNHTRDWT